MLTKIKLLLAAGLIASVASTALANDIDQSVSAAQAAREMKGNAVYSAASAMAQQPSEQLILDCMNQAFSVWQKAFDNTRDEDLQRLNELDRMLTERCMFEHEFKFRADIHYCTTSEFDEAFGLGKPRQRRLLGFEAQPGYTVSNPLCYERIR